MWQCSVRKTIKPPSTQSDALSRWAEFIEALSKGAKRKTKFETVFLLFLSVLGALCGSQRF
jgi:hypothetical protein